MTTITAKIIADSISPQGIRLTTMQLRYPRFIHAEFMTHRLFSRNASSSRAVPTAKLIEDIVNLPAMPLHWGKNQKGMQADEETDAPIIVRDEVTHAEVEVSRERAWMLARNLAVACATAFDKAGYHKQVVNRILEPFAHINVVVTATEWANFFALRRHVDAEPHIRMLADEMWNARQASDPLALSPGEWHTPYVTPDDMNELQGKDTEEVLKRTIQMSVSRCARVSYLTSKEVSQALKRTLPYTTG